ncbi:transmembrane protein 170B-like isoform X2 [Argopecten irradians]|uniref:transmembrane protein 170B-like isoform X2 n=1 Tax=Argopecten irradians TaxID=31199 RepID=UPI003716AD7E
MRWVMASEGGDFNADTSLDSIINVFGLTSSDTLNGFAEMWYQVFLWALFSSIFAHVVAALIAFCRLRKHRYGRWIPAVMLSMGVLSPLTGGVITSAAIAGFYRGSDFVMKPFYALCWGAAQTMFMVFVSFTRILSTL